MNIKEDVLKILKGCYLALKSFFTEEDKGTRSVLTKLDYADIFVSLVPAAIFGCLLFGLRAVLVLLICVAIPLGVDFLWNLILFKQKKVPDYVFAVSGLILGLTLSSRLNIMLVVAISLLTAVLTKVLFNNKPLSLVFPLLITRVVVGTVFLKAFDVYSFPFMTTNAESLPLDYIFRATSFVYPAKYLFFGVHSGNIGETSVLLLLVGGIYLAFRKIINPVIPTCYVVSVGLLSLIFGRSVAISLLGGSLFFAALVLTLDCSFKTTPRYKKILYGISCGVLTFVLREILHTEGALYAVLITHFAFIYINRKNIKYVINWFKKTDFKGLLLKVRAIFKRKV